MATDRRFKLLGQGLPGNTDFKVGDLTGGEMIRWDATSGKWVISGVYSGDANLDINAPALGDPKLNFQVEDTTYWRFFYDESAAIMKLRAVDAATTELRIEDGNTGNMLRIDSTADTILYHTGIASLKTFDRGLQVLSTTASSPYISIRDNTDTETAEIGTTSGDDLLLYNAINSGHVLVQGANSSGTTTTLMQGDPDAATSLSYQGTISLQTRIDGIRVQDTDGNDPLLYFYDDASNPLSRIQHLSNNLLVWNVTNSGWTRLRARNSAGTDVYGLNFDPDSGMGNSGNGLRAILHTPIPSGEGASPTYWWENQASGDSGDFDQDSGGLLLTANGMNTSSRHTPALLFGSTDSAFTTNDPKTLAGIGGRCIETYSGDSDGGMSVVIYASAINPGTAPTMTNICEMRTTGTKWGAPSGGYTGAGTINAKGLYDDGTLLCQPVEDALGRGNGRQEWDDIAPGDRNRLADEYENDQRDGWDGTKDGWRALMETRGSVPGLPNKEQIQARMAEYEDPENPEEMRNNKYSVGERTEHMWLALDYMAVALRDALNKIDELEDRLNGRPDNNPSEQRTAGPS